jgi:hypothetical protein
MRLATLAAVSGVALASSAFAGFSFSHTTTTSGGRQAVNIFALNDGLGGTGTNLTGVSLTYTGSAVRFVVNDTDENEVPDTVDFNARVAGQSWAGLATGGNTVHVGVSPNGSGVEPNPYLSISSFTLAMADLAGGRPATTAPGAQFMRLISADGTAAPSGRIVGEIGGNTGGPVAFEYTFGGVTPPPNSPPAFSAPVYNLVIDFGPGVTPWPGSASGSVVASATDPDAGQTVVISNGALPSFASVVGTNPATYSATLTVEEALALGWTGFAPLVLPDIALTATDSGNPAATASAALRISIIPEPATLGLLAGAGLLALRRRA